MREAAGELNMTIIVIIAVGAILTFLTIFLPQVFESIKDTWNKNKDNDIPSSYIEKIDINKDYYIL